MSTKTYLSEKHLKVTSNSIKGKSSLFTDLKAAGFLELTHIMKRANQSYGTFY